jgi:hypothetical protein
MTIEVTVPAEWSPSVAGISPRAPERPCAGVRCPARAALFYRALGYEESAIYFRRVLEGQADE